MQLVLVLEQSNEQEEIDTVCIRMIAGLGVNMTEIYPKGIPYLNLKGVFNVVEAWCARRDVYGCRMQKAMYSTGDLTVRGASPVEVQVTYPHIVPQNVNLPPKRQSMKIKCVTGRRGVAGGRFHQGGLQSTCVLIRDQDTSRRAPTSLGSTSRGYEHTSLRRQAGG